MNWINYNKIMIFGKPGSGKSTLACLLHKILKLPLIHLDKYFFKANWQEQNYEDFLDIQNNFVNAEKWIIDGNCLHSLEIRYSKADLILYFNYPTSICFWRIIKRLFQTNQFDDRAEGCDKKISLKLIKYILNFENKVTTQLNVLRKKYPHTKFIEIKNDDDLQELTETLHNT